MTRQLFRIENMHCTSCAMSIDGTLEDVAGVVEASTSYARSRTEVTFDPAQVSIDVLIAAIRDAGYDAVPIG